MKIALCIILLIAGPVKLAAQEFLSFNNYEHSIGVQLSGGLTAFNMNEPKQLFSSFVNGFQMAGVPVQIQELYPQNTVWSLTLYYFSGNDFSLYAGLESTGSAAYALYEDVYGTLDIKSKLDMLSFNAGIKKYFMEVNPVQPFIGLQGGYLKSNYNLSVSINYTSLPQFSQYESIAYNEPGFIAEPFLGIAYSLPYIVLELQGGYRYSVIQNASGNTNMRELQGLDIDMSGASVKLSVRGGIYW